jgi:hypothetical protein
MIRKGLLRSNRIPHHRDTRSLKTTGLQRGRIIMAYTTKTRARKARLSLLSNKSSRAGREMRSVKGRDITPSAEVPLLCSIKGKRLSRRGI